MIVAIYARERLAKSIQMVFETCGMHTIVATEMHQVPAIMKRDRPDALLCYRVQPPDIRIIRELLKPLQTNIPIFTVYSRATAVDRINTLRAGIRRVYLEPFPISRLVQDIGTLSYEIPEGESFRIGRFELDIVSVSAKYKGEVLKLTKKQFRLLTLFLERANTVVTKVQIWERVWGIEEYPQTNCVEALVSRLRSALPGNEVIEQVYGVGYRLRVAGAEKVMSLTHVVSPQVRPDSSQHETPLVSPEPLALQK